MNAKDLLWELVSIDSVSGDERALAEHLTERMTELGFDAHTLGMLVKQARLAARRVGN